MTWLETLRTSLESVRSHRLRSSLTVLGITIGIAAVTLTFGLGQGASDKVRAEIAALGTNVLTVTPGSSTAKGVREGYGTGSTLTPADAAALRNRKDAPDVAAVAPVVQANTAIRTTRANWTAAVIGSTPSWLRVRHRRVTEGRFINHQDVLGHNGVIVLGPTVVAQLFPGQDPLGQTVQVNSVPLTVVGVLTTVGATATGSATAADDLAVVPVSTADERLWAVSSLSSIIIQARSTTLLSAAYQEADTELLALNGVASPTSADFTIATPEALVSTASSVSKTLSDLLEGIAGIALLMGGIGVMNVMLMSVTERVREIGLRKALGATRSLIRRQFLVESGVLGVGGGALGVAVGAVAAATLPGVLGDPVDLSAVATVLALAVALGTGLLFGVFPAHRASRLTPIDALRNE